jgi:hypothetical protein
MDHQNELVTVRKREFPEYVDFFEMRRAACDQVEVAE